jgi:hypothetical protein
MAMNNPPKTTGEDQALEPEAGSSSHRHKHQRRPYDPDGVKSTTELSKYLEEGKPMLNNYTRHAKIGGGQHGEVWLCYKIDYSLPLDHPGRRESVVRALKPSLSLFLRANLEPCLACRR